MIEQGSRIAVGLAVTDPHWEGKGRSFKVFTFHGEGGQAVLLQDCRDRDDALTYLASD